MGRLRVRRWMNLRTLISCSLISPKARDHRHIYPIYTYVHHCYFEGKWFISLYLFSPVNVLFELISIIHYDRYHESLVHPTLLRCALSFPSDGAADGLGSPRTVFIGGGGELATAREVLRHRSVKRVVSSRLK